MNLALLAVVGSVCLIVALIQAWLIIAVIAGEDGPMNKLIPNAKELIRSHIDYLMMAQFLFVFYGLFRLMQLSPSIWIVVAMCAGSFFNPFGFFVRALRPSYIKSPPSVFTAFMTTSCIATTVGYALAAWMVAHAALAAAGGP